MKPNFLNSSTNRRTEKVLCAPKEMPVAVVFLGTSPEAPSLLVPRGYTNHTGRHFPETPPQSSWVVQPSLPVVAMPLRAFHVLGLWL